jgi:hypothetical protein
VCSSIKIMPLDGKMAHHCGDVCVMCVSLAKSLPGGCFLFPLERIYLGGKLLTIHYKVTTNWYFYPTENPLH